MNHDAVVATLLDVLEPLGGELRLLYRLADPVIGCDQPNEIFLFVPDLHLVSADRRKRFGRYGFNHEDSGLLATLLEALAKQRPIWEQSGVRLVTMQVGDFLDLWREFPQTPPAGTTVGGEVHARLRNVLYRNVFVGLPCLKSTILLGNHDTKNGVALPEIPFQLRAFNRSVVGRPFLFVTHGDTFDVLEKLVPDAIQEFLVAIVGSLTPVNKYSVGTWGKAASRLNRPLGDMEDAVVAPQHDVSANQRVPRVTRGATLPNSALRIVERPDALSHPFLGKLQEAFLRAPDPHPSASVRVAVVGHTHHARMELVAPGGGGRPLLLLDVGAWIERCSYALDEGGTTTEPSAQIGVLHGNDARIYQVRLPA